MATIDSKIPEGPLAEKWSNYKAHQKLVNPANKRKLDIIVVGSGLAGASAAATLGDLGFKVKLPSSSDVQINKNENWYSILRNRC